MMVSLSLFYKDWSFGCSIHTLSYYELRRRMRLLDLQTDDSITKTFPIMQFLICKAKYSRAHSIAGEKAPEKRVRYPPPDEYIYINTRNGHRRLEKKRALAEDFNPHVHGT